MFADFHAYLFYSITDCKIFHALWKDAFIRPLHKSLSKASIENYRPISLLSKISKISEQLLFVYLFGLCKAQLHPKQFGFQSRKNAVLQLRDYLETLYGNKSSTLFSVYLDYEKAFDKIPNKILLSKLKLFGFDSELLLLFESYLNGRTQVVNVNGYFSEHLSVPSEVPHGSVPGPFSFLIYLSMTIRVFFLIWLFADDHKLLFPLNFHNDLTRLYNWILSNGMIANLGKTNCLKLKILTYVTMNDCLLKKVDYTKDLGIIVSHNLKWTDSVQMKFTKAQRSFFIEAKNSIPKPIIQPLFLTSVICSFIWDPILVTRYN